MTIPPALVAAAGKLAARWAESALKRWLDRRRARRKAEGKWMRPVAVLILAGGLAGCGTINRWLDRATDAWMPETPAVTNAPAIPGPRLLSVKEAGSYRVDIALAGLDSWPDKKLDNGKVVCGWVYVNGGRVDKIARAGGVKGLENLKHGSEYYQQIRKGDVVRVKVRSYYGAEETNEIEFEWPWSDTETTPFREVAP